MKKSLLLSVVMAVGLLLVFDVPAEAQRKKGKRNSRGQAIDRIGVSNPLAIGESGVAWYTTWETGLAEAKRSNRPIFFMSAATTCSGVPGVF